MAFFFLMASQTMANSQNHGSLPPGKGRQAILDNCTACHSTAIILQQRMSRERWDVTISWMQEKQGLWKLEPSVRKKILDYLSGQLGPQSPQPSPESDQKSPASSSPYYDYYYPANPL